MITHLLTIASVKPQRHGEENGSGKIVKRKRNKDWEVRVSPSLVAGRGKETRCAYKRGRKKREHRATGVQRGGMRRGFTHRPELNVGSARQPAERWQPLDVSSEVVGETKKRDKNKKTGKIGRDGLSSYQHLSLRIAPYDLSRKKESRGWEKTNPGKKKGWM